MDTAPPGLGLLPSREPRSDRRRAEPVRYRPTTHLCNSDRRVLPQPGCWERRQTWKGIQVHPVTQGQVVPA